MRTDRAAFTFGILALTLAGIALWSVYGHLDWRGIGLIIPGCLVVLGVGLLFLSKPNH